MKRAALFLLLSFVVLSSGYTLSPSLQYLRHPGGDAYVGVWQTVSASSDGGVSILSYRNNGTVPFQTTLSHFDAVGTYLWSTDFSASNHSFNFILWHQSIPAVDNRGTLYVGWGDTNEYTDISLVLISTKGSVVTSSSFRAPGYLYPADITATKNGYMISAVHLNKNLLMIPVSANLQVGEVVSISYSYFSSSVPNATIDDARVAYSREDGASIVSVWLRYGTQGAITKVGLLKVASNNTIEWSKMLVNSNSPNSSQWPMKLVALDSGLFVSGSGQYNGSSFVVFDTNGNIQQFFDIGLEGGGRFAAPVSMQALPNSQLLLSLNVGLSNASFTTVLPTISIVSITSEDFEVKWTYMLNNPPANGSYTVGTGSLAVTSQGYALVGDQSNMLPNDSNKYIYLAYFSQSGLKGNCGYFDSVNLVITQQEVEEVATEYDVTALELQNVSKEYVFNTPSIDPFDIVTQCVY